MSDKTPPEVQIANTLKDLRGAVIVLTVAVMLTIGLSIFGFATASSATDQAATVAKHQAAVAHQIAELASAKAKTATGVSSYALSRLQAEATGECYRVDYLRWQIDRERYADWQRDRYAARFLRGLHHRATDALASYFRSAGRSALFLPLTDCTLATESPTTYHPPGAVPFSKVSRVELRGVFAHAPQPPSAP